MEFELVKLTANNKHHVYCIYYDNRLLQQTLLITNIVLLMTFKVQLLQKHEATKLLQPTGHLTHKSHPILACVLLVGSPHAILGFSMVTCLNASGNGTISIVDT